MPNLHDYILWRGDLSFEQDPLNEVDMLLLSQLSYAAFGPFVPGPTLFPQYVTLKSAVQRLLEYDGEGTYIHQHAFLWKNIRKLLEAAAASRRYGDIRLSAYVDELSDESQFAALCMDIGESLKAVAFRGTDDSIAGWKEDLLMALDDPIPAQKRASEYLAQLMDEMEGDVVLTGHSKGGNLAVFAAVHLPPDKRARIRQIANLDGPGFSRSLQGEAGFEDLRDRICVLLPESSVVGRLLEQEAQFHIVRATALGIFQHDAFTWQVQGPNLVRAERLTAYSEYLNCVIRAWLEKLSNEQRREFLEAVFAMFSDVDAKTVSDAPAALFAALPQIIRKMSTLDKEHKDAMITMVKTLGEAAIRGLRIRGQKEKALPGGDTRPGD